MRTSLKLATAMVFGLVAATSACIHDNDDYYGKTSTTAAAVGSGGAAAVLARVRCKREAECNNIGHGPYAAADNCLDAIDKHERFELSPARACPAGINTSRLDKCVASLEYQVCENPLGDIEDIAECHTRELCSRR